MGPHRNKHRLFCCPRVGLSYSLRLAFTGKLLYYQDFRPDKLGENGDPCGNRTRVTGVRGRCLNRLTNGPSRRGIYLIHDHAFRRALGPSFGAPSGIRTRDPLIKSQLLYQLS